MIKEIDSAELQQKLADGEELLLLDIRSEAELAQGVLPGAEFLPMHLIPVRMSEFPKDKEIVLYCRSGSMSTTAAETLVSLGYANVFEVDGGMRAWQAAGYELLEQ